MKKLKGLKEVKLLSKNEQKSILGGLACFILPGEPECPGGTFCCHGMCRIDGYPCGF